MAKKLYYKVCRLSRETPRYVSFSHGCWGSFVPLAYEVGKVTTRKIGDGPCCVFDSMDAATAFLNKYADMKVGYCIMECHITKSKSTCVWQNTVKLTNGKVFRSSNIVTMLPGTVLAISVTPQKIVYKDNAWGIKDI